ncbi:methyl-accepting chemotaxis protein [Agrobacterium sp. SORGH_AS 787]|uniref:methyl-accepting chemotaxis protein n=1 Tax=Agrobacterium sp. SORGH_AS 787 TaxID=3041775 RepID=UPI002784FFDF|nr:methyl-accepting chemotaxis protein [Rhizobium sp. SORGH_AS_0787]
MSLLKNAAIRTKILAVVAPICVVGIAGVVMMAERYQSSNDAYNKFITADNIAAIRMSNATSSLVATSYNAYRSIANGQNETARQSAASEYRINTKAFGENLSFAKALIPQRAAEIDEFGRRGNAIFAVADQAIDLDAAGRHQEALATLAKTDPMIAKWGKDAYDWNNANIQQIQSDGRNLSTGADNSILFTLVATSLLYVVGLGAALLVSSRGITQPIARLRERMMSLAQGENDAPVDGQDRRDEVGGMAAAVSVFRENAIERIKLEAEATAARNQSAEERERTATADRLRSAEMAKATSGLGEGLRHLANGNLSFELIEPFAPDFETLRIDFNAAVTQLSETLLAVASAAGTIDSGSQEVSTSANDLSKRTEQQAAALEETAAALDQITVNVTNSSKRAEDARRIAAEANESATQSGRVVANAVEAMEKIEASSNQVSNIIGVIDEIAFQTNLLALNAGVEAARAGDAGKGFAVVAQEVRELAQRSAQAAKEIKDLIRNSSTEVQHGVKLVGDTGIALKTIENYIVAVNQHMDAIATSAKEQSVGLAEVNTAVNQMDRVTQQNAAMVEESSAAGAQLAAESTKLRELISQFQLKDASRRRVSTSEADGDQRSTHSPAKMLVHRVGRVFSGNAALKDSWEEF